MNVSIFRPVKGPLVIHLPFLPSGGNYALLHKILGGRRVRVVYRAGIFEVTASHLSTLIAGLLDEFGSVELTTEHWVHQTCVERCWNAKPSTTAICVCGCAGQNHGTRQPFERLALDGSVSIHGEYLRRTQLLVW